MTYQKINVVAELEKMAKGRATKAPTWLIAEMALPRVKAIFENREVFELERLFGLPDPRI